MELIQYSLLKLFPQNYGEKMKKYTALIFALLLSACGTQTEERAPQASQESLPASEVTPVSVSEPLAVSTIEVTSEMETQMEESLRDYDKQVDELNRKEKAQKEQIEKAKKSLKESNEAKVPEQIAKPQETIVDTEPLNAKQ